MWCALSTNAAGLKILTRFGPVQVARERRPEVPMSNRERNRPKT